MKELSLLEMATTFLEAEVAIRANATRALERVAVAVEKTAKAEFGHYQYAIGPFPAWAELADSTKEERVRLGYTENDPLLRSGETRNSISHGVADLEAVIGSDSEILKYHEIGTSRMPPRPVLGPAVVHNIDRIVDELGGAVVSGIIEGDAIHSSLGYDRVLE